MELSETDKELLELVMLKVPWYMVCGDFHERYGSPGALAERLMALQYEALLEVRSNAPGGEPPDAEHLERDATANDCYRDLEATTDPVWEVVATDKGVAMIADRLDRE